MNRFSPFEASLWFATAEPAPSTRELEESLDADVCIVGAGYTGLTTALELAKKNVSVVVVEAQEAGFGGSGRNAGHCTPTFTHYSLGELRRMLGEPWAERLIQRQTRANDRVGMMIRDYQIACEWQQNGYVMGALQPANMRTLEHKVEEYNAVGAKTRSPTVASGAESTGCSCASCSSRKGIRGLSSSENGIWNTRATSSGSGVIFKGASPQTTNGVIEKPDRVG